MRKTTRLALALAASLTVGTAGAALADATYRTERLELVALGAAPLKGGMVVNAHANGRIYAHEQYTLLGALPHTTYQVVLLGDLDGTACATAAELMLPTATITTNAAGNGTAKMVFSPADVAGLAGMTVGARWQVTLASG